MRSNQLREKIKKLRKQLDDREIISTFADLVSWEYENAGSNKRPKLSGPFKKQLHESGLYLDL